MAKKSKIERNKQRIAMVERYAERRKELYTTIKSSDSSFEEREEAYKKLRNLPKNSSPIRVRNRCNLTGRARAYYRRFGLSRIALRERAVAGELPGVTKASW